MAEAVTSAFGGHILEILIKCLQGAFPHPKMAHGRASKTAPQACTVILAASRSLLSLNELYMLIYVLFFRMSVNWLT